MSQIFFSTVCAFLQMDAFLRDTPAGHFLRFIGFKRRLPYPEEVPGFRPPSMPVVSQEDEAVPSSNAGDLEKVQSRASIAIGMDQTDITRRLSKDGLSKDGLSEAIVVSWTENDSDNPRNWSSAKKNWTLTLINLYTFVVYCTASIITPTAEFITQRFNVSIVVASLGLSMYVVGCELT